MLIDTDWQYHDKASLPFLVREAFACIHTFLDIVKMDFRISSMVGKDSVTYNQY
jgi:hypothetical protein